MCAGGTARACPNTRSPRCRRRGDHGAAKYAGGIIKEGRDLDAESDELNRRLEWTERHTGRFDFETVLLNLQIELGYESAL